MRKVLIWGTGTTSDRVTSGLQDCEIIGFLDNDKSKWGEQKDGIPILGDETSLPNENDYDEIVICALGGYNEISKQLSSVGVPANKINGSYVETMIKARMNFINDYSKLYNYADTEFCVAEGGVYQGELSKVINQAFPRQKLFLFDTFEGFVEKDIEMEKEMSFSQMGVGHLNNTSEELVLSKMVYPENVEIRKGYFPDTAYGLEDRKFCFVNLDFDLYNPTLAGLRFFWPKITEHGVILVHDYYSVGYKGVNKAIDEFIEEENGNIRLMPIGDHCSVALVK